MRRKPKPRYRYKPICQACGERIYREQDIVYWKRLRKGKEPTYYRVEGGKWNSSLLRQFPAVHAGDYRYRYNGRTCFRDIKGYHHHKLEIVDEWFRSRHNRRWKREQQGGPRPMNPPRPKPAEVFFSQGPSRANWLELRPESEARKAIIFPR